MFLKFLSYIRDNAKDILFRKAAGKPRIIDRRQPYPSLALNRMERQG